MINTEIKIYTPEQMVKLTQYDRVTSVTQFLFGRGLELSMGAAFRFRTPEQEYTFDMADYFMLARASSRLFNQLVDMGLADEVKAITLRK